MPAGIARYLQLRAGGKLVITADSAVCLLHLSGAGLGADPHADHELVELQRAHTRFAAPAGRIRLGRRDGAARPHADSGASCASLPASKRQSRWWGRAPASRCGTRRSGRSRSNRSVAVNDRGHAPGAGEIFALSAALSHQPVLLRRRSRHYTSRRTESMWTARLAAAATVGQFSRGLGPAWAADRARSRSGCGRPRHATSAMPASISCTRGSASCNERGARAADCNASTACCSTWACPRRSSRRRSAASASASTGRSTCAWTRARGRPRRNGSRRL